MLQIVTVPGGTGVTIAIPFSSGDNAAAATMLLQNLYQSALSERNIVDYSTTGSRNALPGEVNVLVADTAGAAAVPAGFQYLVGDYLIDTQDPARTNAFIAGGNLDGSQLVSTAGMLNFTAGTGMATIVAGGGISISTLQTASPGGEVFLDGIGTEQASFASGNWRLSTGTGPGQIYLGSGIDSVFAQGSDMIHGGVGQAYVDLEASNEVLQGGSGTETVVVDAIGDTIDAGSGRSTVTANGNGLVLAGGGAEVLFVDKAGGNHLIGNNSGLVVFASPFGGSTYEASNSYFLFISEGGSDTITAAADKMGPVVFGFPGCDVHVNSLAPGTFVASGSGPETIDASGSDQSAVFFSGTGAIDMIGATGVANFFAANVGSSTMSGGSGNVYDFIDQHSGNTNLITDFHPNDLLYLTNFGLAPDDGIANEVVANGTLHMTLTDGTLIIFQNISSAAQIAGQIYHN